MPLEKSVVPEFDNPPLDDSELPPAARATVKVLLRLHILHPRRVVIVCKCYSNIAVYYVTRNSRFLQTMSSVELDTNYALCVYMWPQPEDRRATPLYDFFKLGPKNKVTVFFSCTNYSHFFSIHMYCNLFVFSLPFHPFDWYYTRGAVQHRPYSTKQDCSFVRVFP